MTQPSSSHQPQGHSQAPEEMKKKKKQRRFRTSFTRWQLEMLEEHFTLQQYIVGEERVALAQKLSLNPIQVKVWFQNRRIKWRRQQASLNIFPLHVPRSN